MSDDGVTRRDALKVSGAGVVAGAVIAFPGGTEAAGMPANPSPPLPRGPIVLSVLREEVKAYIASLSQEHIDGLLKAAYSEVFKRREIDAWTHHDFEVGLGFAITRKAIREGLWRGDLPGTIDGLIKAFTHQRDIRAAELFNNPYSLRKMEASAWERHKFGDRPIEGKPLLSVETGNTFEVPRELNRQTMAAVEAKAKDAGVALKAILVPKKLEGEARSSSTLPVIVWDKLTNPQAWFVLTDADGLFWDERDPLEMDCWVDNITDNLLVKGYERGGFVCSNQFAVIGSAPAAPFCTQAQDYIQSQKGVAHAFDIAGLALLKGIT